LFHFFNQYLEQRKIGLKAFVLLPILKGYKAIDFTESEHYFPTHFVFAIENANFL